MSLLGRVSKIVSILLSKLSTFPNNNALLCYCNYPFFNSVVSVIAYFPTYSYTQHWGYRFLKPVYTHFEKNTRLLSMHICNSDECERAIDNSA